MLFGKREFWFREHRKRWFLTYGLNFFDAFMPYSTWNFDNRICISDSLSLFLFSDWKTSRTTKFSRHRTDKKPLRIRFRHSEHRTVPWLGHILENFNYNPISAESHGQANGDQADLGRLCPTKGHPIEFLPGPNHIGPNLKNRGRVFCLRRHYCRKIHRHLP